MSVRTPDGGLLVTPTGASFGRLDPDRLSVLDAQGRHVGGDRPTKEMPLHAAFHDTRPGTGAVVHLHSTHATALSMLPDIDPDDAVPPLTPYLVMRVGRVALLPFFVPGDDAMADAVRALGGRRAAVLLAHHGPVVAGATLEAAVFAMEELEETARLALILRGTGARPLSADQIARVSARYGGV
ncbi:aldolase [Rhodobaculum claviforme]|uniref:Aldolase n=1 Tax=Rhodobaculum claviforme TaxID=1549854 RepID=A0A934WE20_9RHOB|nr:aldolase [Rhodobaculum claviforme]